MDNSQKPAYPTDLEVEKVKDEDSPFPHFENIPLTGLTKRERFAMAALESGAMPHNTHEFQENAHWCKCQADALLKELEDYESQ